MVALKKILNDKLKRKMKLIAKVLFLVAVITLTSCKKETPKPNIVAPPVKMVHITGYMLFVKNTNDTIVNFTGVSVRFYNSSFGLDTTIASANLTYITDTWMYPAPWPGLASGASTSQYNIITISVPENSSWNMQIIKGDGGAIMYEQIVKSDANFGFSTGSVGQVSNNYVVHRGNRREGITDYFTLNVTF